MTGTASRGRDRALEVTLDTLALGLIALYLGTFLVRNVSLQWDFKTYLLAARTALAGLDPYRMEDLAAIAGRAAPFPFIYPPIALLPFLGLISMAPAAAATTWMLVKLALLAGLVALWTRRFAPGAGVLPVALVAVFGWNGAALADLRSGNVALVENALLWTGFVCFVAGRRAAFALLVVAAACFKLAPAVFLLLLLVPDRERRAGVTLLLMGVGALAALVWVPLWIGPAAGWTGFLENVPDAATLGEANPSAFGLAVVLASGWSRTGAASLATAVWALYVIALLVVSLPFLRRAWRSRDPLAWVMIAVFLELLIAPRPMAYGWVRLAPAPLFLAPARFRTRAGFLVIAAMLCAQGFLRAMSLQTHSLAAIYAPFLLTLMLWLWIVSERSGSAATASTESRVGRRSAADRAPASTRRIS